MTFDLIARELEQASFYNFYNSYEDKRSFEGKADEITFFNAGEKGIYSVTYKLAVPERTAIHKIMVGQKTSKNYTVVNKRTESDSVAYLIRKEQEFADFAGPDIIDDSEAEIISTHVREGGFKLSYGYTDKENAAQILWKDVWDMEYYPEAVKVVIDFIISDKNDRVITIERNLLIPAGGMGTEKQESEDEVW